MKILVINAGSSSLKYQLIDMENESVIAKGICERIGIEGSNLVHKANGKETKYEQAMPDHTVAIKMVIDALTDQEVGVLSSLDEIGAIGHRVVGSGEYFTKTTLVTPEALETLKKTYEFAPIHNPANVMGIMACMEAMPGKSNVAVFDTAFHSTMPDEAKLYAIDYQDYQDYKVRRYGAHGTSHKYVSQEAIKYCDAEGKDFKIVTLHLGGGSSISAVKNGICIDTSMGFTPLAGVPMGTRSGDIDPSAAKFLAEKKGMTFDETINYLNKKCGVMGVSGVSSDFRDLQQATEAGNYRAELAVNLFAYNVKKYIGAYTVAMGGLDCLVFTAGIGENSAFTRARILKGLECLGVEFDAEKNKQRSSSIMEITGENSKVRVLVIPTNEELMIARETLALC
ncbi:MAG: acetate kinase [Clostridia bacterium]|nr:acetate kinase [Clostridia bacterium]